MAVVLAAGQGKRMKSKLYKVLHPVCGKPMVGHVMDTVEHVNCDHIVVVVGHGAEAVQQYVGQRVNYAVQTEQLGTGHAVKQAQTLLGDKQGTTFVICGDTPLITEQTLTKLLEVHHNHQATATILTARLDDASGYGRVIRAKDESVLKIVEHKDCTLEHLQVKEINTGTYCFDNEKFFIALEQIKNDNSQQEYYLTDVIDILKKNGEMIQAYCTADIGESIGVNDRVALSVAERLMRERINTYHMLNGVTIIDPLNTYIETEVTIGADTIIEPGSRLRGKTTIGNNCVIGPNCEITDCTIENQVYVQQSVMEGAFIDEQSTVGPFAYLRPGTRIGKQVKVGDFVEIKNATLDAHTKVSHLTYIGDAEVGRHVNIGCGTVTVNYDGYNKSVTKIGDHAFIGSNVNLIAPIEIGKGAYVVAGSTITDDVPDNDLAIARERQVNKPGYAEKVRIRAQLKKEEHEHSSGKE